MQLLEPSVKFMIQHAVVAMFVPGEALLLTYYAAYKHQQQTSANLQRWHAVWYSHSEDRRIGVRWFQRGCTRYLIPFWANEPQHQLLDSWTVINTFTAQIKT